MSKQANIHINSHRWLEHHLTFLIGDGMGRGLSEGRSSHVMSSFIGLDVHSEHTFATVLDQDGRVVAQKKMLSEHVPNFLRLFNVERVGLEASTHMAPLYRALVHACGVLIAYMNRLASRKQIWIGVWR